LADVIDNGRARAVWDAALEATDWQREPVWFHGDLLSGNVLVEQGRLSAVIDFGGLAVGDFDSVIVKL
jgi:aminoglycoside phosphotransferase (APT) family kinase protein